VRSTHLDAQACVNSAPHSTHFAVLKRYSRLSMGDTIAWQIASALLLAGPFQAADWPLAARRVCKAWQTAFDLQAPTGCKKARYCIHAMGNKGWEIPETLSCNWMGLCVAVWDSAYDKAIPLLLPHLVRGQVHTLSLSHCNKVTIASAAFGQVHWLFLTGCPNIKNISDISSLDGANYVCLRGCTQFTDSAVLAALPRVRYLMLPSGKEHTRT
jgi:hypothetical protein